MASWFSYQPVSRPAPKPQPRDCSPRPAPPADSCRECAFAILGTRGIPANYGGFETFAEELSTRLAARGHQVTVYCRERYSEPMYRGVHLQYLPTIRHKYFDTLAHTFLSTLHLLTTAAGRRALLQRAPTPIFTLDAAHVRHARRAECGRPGAQSQEVESRWRKPGIACPNGSPPGCRTPWSPTRRPSRTIIGSATSATLP